MFGNNICELIDNLSGLLDVALVVNLVQAKCQFDPRGGERDNQPQWRGWGYVLMLAKLHIPSDVAASVDSSTTQVEVLIAVVVDSKFAPGDFLAAGNSRVYQYRPAHLEVERQSLKKF